MNFSYLIRVLSVPALSFRWSNYRNNIWKKRTNSETLRDVVFYPDVTIYLIKIYSRHLILGHHYPIFFFYGKKMLNPYLKNVQKTDILISGFRHFDNIHIDSNVTVRQQIGIEETVIKDIQQNQLTWYSHVQRMAEGRLPRISLKWMPKQKRARGRPKKNWMEGIKKAMNERKLNEGQWEYKKQWSLGVGQRRKTF